MTHEMAKAVSEILAAALNARVVVTAGIHWDDLSPEAISRVIQNSEKLVEMILEKIAAATKNRPPARTRGKPAKG